MLLAIVEEQQRATKAAHDKYTQSLEITQLSRKTKLIRQLRTGTKKKTPWDKRQGLRVTRPIQETTGSIEDDPTGLPGPKKQWTFMSS